MELRDRGRSLAATGEWVGHGGVGLSERLVRSTLTTDVESVGGDKRWIDGALAVTCNLPGDRGDVQRCHLEPFTDGDRRRWSPPSSIQGSRLTPSSQRITAVTDRWLQHTVDILVTGEIERRDSRRNLQRTVIRSRSLEVIYCSSSERNSVSEFMGNANRRPDKRRRSRASSSRSNAELLDNEVPPSSSLLVRRRPDRPLYRSATIDGAFGDVAGAAGSFYDVGSGRPSSGTSTWSMMSEPIGFGGAISDVGSVQSVTVRADLHSSFMDDSDADHRRDGAITVYNVRSSASRFGQQRGSNGLDGFGYQASVSMAGRQETAEQGESDRLAVDEEFEKQDESPIVYERDEQHTHSSAVAPLAIPERTSPDDHEQVDELRCASDGENFRTGKSGKKSLRNQRGQSEFEFVDFSDYEDDDNNDTTNDTTDDDTDDTTDESDSVECTEPTVEQILFAETSEEEKAPNDVETNEKYENNQHDHIENGNVEVSRPSFSDGVVPVNSDFEEASLPRSTIDENRLESPDLSGDISGISNSEEYEISENDESYETGVEGECNSLDALIVLDDENEKVETNRAEVMDTSKSWTMSEANERVLLNDELILTETETHPTEQQKDEETQEEEKLSLTETGNPSTDYGKPETTELSSDVRENDSWNCKQLSDIEVNSNFPVALSALEDGAKQDMMIMEVHHAANNVDHGSINITYPYEELTRVLVLGTFDETTRLSGSCNKNGEQTDNTEHRLLPNQSEDKIDEILSESSDSSVSTPAEYSPSRVAYVAGRDQPLCADQRTEITNTSMELETCDVATVTSDFSALRATHNTCAPQSVTVSRITASMAGRPKLNEVHSAEIEVIENSPNTESDIETVRCVDEAIEEVGNRPATDDDTKYSTDDGTLKHGISTGTSAFEASGGGSLVQENDISFEKDEAPAKIGQSRCFDEKDAPADGLDAESYDGIDRYYFESDNESEALSFKCITDNNNLEVLTNVSLDSNVSSLSSSTSDASPAEESQNAALMLSDDSNTGEDNLQLYNEKAIGENQTGKGGENTEVDGGSIGTTGLVEICEESAGVKAIDWLYKELSADNITPENLLEDGEINGAPGDSSVPDKRVDQPHPKEIGDTGSELDDIEQVSSNLVSNVISIASHFVRQCPTDVAEISAPFDHTARRNTHGWTQYNSSAVKTINTLTVSDSQIERAVLIVEINVIDGLFESLPSNVSSPLEKCDQGNGADAYERARGHPMASDERLEKFNDMHDDFDKHVSLGVTLTTVANLNDVLAEYSRGSPATTSHLHYKEPDCELDPITLKYGNSRHNNAFIERGIGECELDGNNPADVDHANVMPLALVFTASTSTDQLNDTRVVSSVEGCIVDDVLEMNPNRSVTTNGSAKGDCSDSEIDTDDMVNAWTLVSTAPTLVSDDMNDTQELFDALEQSILNDDLSTVEQGTIQPTVFVPDFETQSNVNCNFIAYQAQHVSGVRIHTEDAVAENATAAGHGTILEELAASSNHRSLDWSTSSKTVDSEVLTAFQNFVFDSGSSPEFASITACDVCKSTPSHLPWPTVDIDNGHDTVVADSEDMSFITMSTINDTEETATQTADVSVIDDVLEVGYNVSAVVSDVVRHNVHHHPSKTIDDDEYIVETAVRHVDITGTGASNVSSSENQQTVGIVEQSKSWDSVIAEGGFVRSSNAAAQSPVTSSNESSWCSVDRSPATMLHVHRPDGARVRHDRPIPFKHRLTSSVKNVITSRAAARSTLFGPSSKESESTRLRSGRDFQEGESISWSHFDVVDFGSSSTTNGQTIQRRTSPQDESAAFDLSISSRLPASFHQSERWSTLSVAAHGTGGSHCRPEPLLIPSTLSSQRSDTLPEMDERSFCWSSDSVSAYVTSVYLNRINSEEHQTLKLQIEAEETRLRQLMRENETTLMALEIELDQVVLPQLQLRRGQLDNGRIESLLASSRRPVIEPRQYGMHHVLRTDRSSIGTGNRTVIPSRYGLSRNVGPISAHSDDVNEPWLKLSLDSIARYQATAWHSMVSISELIYRTNRPTVHRDVYKSSAYREGYHRRTGLW